MSFPIFLRLEGKTVLVVGGGRVAEEKGRGLAAHGAVLRVVAPDVAPGLREIASEARLRSFEPADVDGAWLIVAAATPEVNAAARRAADARSLFTIAVDDAASCSAFGAAQIHREGLTLAISSDGRAPGVVALLRRALEHLLGDDVDGWVEAGERARAEWRKSGVPIPKRRSLLIDVLQRLEPRSEP